ncbi:unnamed protein product [Rhizophagus irregularis]|uniref:Uncharacterized protein n=1 Tax=Rhizophagus irregularis TaxID=588596 RepID=A0A915Z9H2_9GLOM|nr:unnamed protein product [Rhizophagus irregularis]CAB5368117.1 unnamed protein product [Rhizophagus irregularis]
MALENVNNIDILDEDVEIDDDASNKSIILEEREGTSKASDVWNKHSGFEKLQETSIEDILKAVPKLRNQVFADLIRTLHPDAKLISADTVKKRIMDLYENNINKWFVARIYQQDTVAEIIYKYL